MSVLTKGDVSDVLGPLESGQVSDLERRFSVRVHHLRRVLDPRQPTSVDKLLQVCDTVWWSRVSTCWVQYVTDQSKSD